MMRMKKIDRIKLISNYLDLIISEPKCELIYSNDYELLISIVLSAQTTDKMVNMVTPILFSKYDSLSKLKCAELKDLENIIRPIGSFRKKAVYIREISKELDEKYSGKVPTDRDLLMKLPGVGRKTINVFLSEYYGIPAFAVDTHVERVSKRLGISFKDDSVMEIENKLMKFFPENEWGKRHLQMVLFGRYYCTAIHPKCCECKLREICIEKRKYQD